MKCYIFEIIWTHNCSLNHIDGHAAIFGNEEKIRDFIQFPVSSVSYAPLITETSDLCSKTRGMNLSFEPILKNVQ